MNFSKLTTIIGACMFCIVSGFTQKNNQYSPEQLAEKVTKKMSESIHLQDGQFDIVNDINRNTALRNYEIRRDSELNVAKKRELIQENHDIRSRFLQDVLSPEQFRKFLEFEQAMKSKQQTATPKVPVNKNTIEQPNPEFGEL